MLKFSSNSPQVGVKSLPSYGVYQEHLLYIYSVHPVYMCINAVSTAAGPGTTNCLEFL